MAAATYGGCAKRGCGLSGPGTRSCRGIGLGERHVRRVARQPVGRQADSWRHAQRPAEYALRVQARLRLRRRPGCPWTTFGGRPALGWRTQLSLTTERGKRGFYLRVARCSAAVCLIDGEEFVLRRLVDAGAQTRVDFQGNLSQLYLSLLGPSLSPFQDVFQFGDHGLMLPQGTD